MKLFEEISGMLSGFFMLLSFSKNPAATLPIILICSLIGVILSFFFSNGSNLRQKTGISSVSAAAGTVIGICVALLSPFLSYWIASLVAFFINFIFFRTYYAKPV